MNTLSVNPMAVIGLPLTEQIQILDAQGTGHFGLHAPACAAHGWGASLTALEKAEGSLAYLCHGPSASADDDASWAAEVRFLRSCIDFAADAGAPWVYLTTGRQGSLLWEEAAARVAGHLAPLVEYARERAVGVVLENTMSIRSDISLTHSVRDAASLAARIGASLCVDLYCCWGEADLERTLGENLDRIAIVQISDMLPGDLDLPNRRVPGDGAIPLGRLLSLVRDLGYGGLIDVELIGPEIDRQGPMRALERSVEWLRAQLVEREE